MKTDLVFVFSDDQASERVLRLLVGDWGYEATAAPRQPAPLQQSKTASKSTMASVETVTPVKAVKAIVCDFVGMGLDAGIAYASALRARIGTDVPILICSTAHPRTVDPLIGDRWSIFEKPVFPGMIKNWLASVNTEALQE